MTKAKMKEETENITTIFRDGGVYRLYGNVGIVGELPNKVLDLKIDAFGSPYLEESSSIKLPEKIYSNDKSFIEHVLRSYKSSTSALGMLLSGKKGLGKSFTANVIISRLNLPVIRITKSVMKGIDLFAFLNRIEQEHVVFIDEFEKIFSSRGREDNEGKMMTQNDFLSYLDGGSLSRKRMFIITANEDVSHYLMNRPTRIRYHRKYEQMHITTIREIIDDLLVNKDFTEDLIENLSQRYINIDVLIKIIEEVNLHNMPYSEFKDFFNFSNGETMSFDVVTSDGDILEGLELRLPLRTGRTLFWDEQRDDIRLEKVIKQSNHELVVKVRWENPEWNPDDENSQEHIYDTFTLRRKYMLAY